MSKVKIFTSSGSLYLAEKIAQEYGKPLGAIVIQKFSDGEIVPFYKESVRGHDIFLIGSMFGASENILELLLMIDAAKRASAKYVTVVVPYFGYARQDRKDRPRIAIAAKLMANVLTAAGADRIMTCDLHAGQIQGFFDIPVDHLYASYIFIPYIQKLNVSNLLFASPDVGGTKRVRAYATHFGAEMVICDKYRNRPNEVAEMRIIGNVEGKDVLLVDDIIDTGGTLSKAADIIMDQGASSVRAICTHAILSGKAYENIEKSALQKLVVTDTVPLKQQSEKIEVLSVAQMFATCIRKTHKYESINSLFIQI